MSWVCFGYFPERTLPTVQPLSFLSSVLWLLFVIKRVQGCFIGPSRSNIPVNIGSHKLLAPSSEEKMLEGVECNITISLCTCKPLSQVGPSHVPVVKTLLSHWNES